MKYACCPETQHTKQKVWSPPECRSDSNSEIVMEKSWWPEAAPRLLFFSLLRREKEEHMWIDSPPTGLYLTPNWTPHKASCVLTNAVCNFLNVCQRNSLLYHIIISFSSCGRKLLLMLAQQKQGQSAHLSDIILRLLFADSQPIYYILPLICYPHFHYPGPETLPWLLI